MAPSCRIARNEHRLLIGNANINGSKEPGDRLVITEGGLNVIKRRRYGG